MKLGPIFSVLFVLASLFRLPAEAQGGGKLCPKEMTLDGTCAETGGASNCAMEFLAKYGASAMPQYCSCSDLQHQQRLCRCDIVCL